MDLDDMINAHLEREEQREDHKQRSLDDLFVQLATAVASADFALSHARDDAKSIGDSFEAVRNQLVDALKRNEIELVGKVGEKVDASLHTVVESQDTDIEGPPRIVEILSYGALCGKTGRLLAHAKVVASVFAGPSRE